VKSVNNLRGWEAIVYIDDEPCWVTIITHIRNDRWLVEGDDLPERFERYRGCRRTIVEREDMMLTVAS